MTTITVEREMLEQALEALTYQGSTISIRWQRQVAAVVALRAAIAAPATAPAWHDAPTAPGLWLSEHNNAILSTWRFSDALFERGYWTKPKTRWCGPIPADFDEKRWSDRADELLRIFDDSGDTP